MVGLRFFVLSFVLLLVVGCSCSSDKSAPGDNGDGGGALDGSADGLDSSLGFPPGDTTPFEVNMMGQVLCDGDTPCACNDGEDNDKDGLVDGKDPECTGPGDNDESSFATGISGDNKDPKWQDCFYDGNSGAGDDKCRYSTKCLTGELPLTDKDCKVAKACIDFCRPRTPNGCDCFGCCDVTFADDSTKSILISQPCESDDPDGCTECVKSTQCDNECGECELCPGKTLADLPDSCDNNNDEPQYTCDNGEDRCPDGSNSECQSGYYCDSGCCIVALL